MGFTAGSTVPDGDDTAMVFRVLRGGGFAVQPDVFRLFEADDYFVTFPLERNQSVSTNAHVLYALRNCGDFPGRERMIAKAIAFLRASHLPAGMWRDKWHASAYYATGRVFLALEGREDASEGLLGPAVEWLVKTQRGTGAWSELDAAGTCEETAYALQALSSLPHPSRSVVAAMNGAASYLWDHIDNHDYPELWVGKALYAPFAVIRAAILGALYAHQHTAAHPRDRRRCLTGELSHSTMRVVASSSVWPGAALTLSKLWPTRECAGLTAVSRISACSLCTSPLFWRWTTPSRLAIRCLRRSRSSARCCRGVPRPSHSSAHTSSLPAHLFERRSHTWRRGSPQRLPSTSHFSRAR